jgi:hypothetical protein
LIYDSGIYRWMANDEMGDYEKIVAAEGTFVARQYDLMGDPRLALGVDAPIMVVHEWVIQIIDNGQESRDESAQEKVADFRGWLA